jgi:hypothetical protein
MSKTKIVITLVAIAALTLVIVGLASAQVAASQTYAGSTPNSIASSGGFFGWMGRCLGFGNSQPYGKQNIAPQAQPTTGTIPTPNQGVYGYGYGYGPCMGLR